MNRQYTWDKVLLSLDGEEFKDVKPIEYQTASVMEYYHRRGNDIFLRGANGIYKISLADSDLAEFQKLWKKGSAIKVEHSTEWIISR